MVLFAGEVMRDKISKICSYFGASLYKFPEGVEDYRSMVAEVARRLVESDEIIGKGEQVSSHSLGRAGATRGPAPRPPVLRPPVHAPCSVHTLTCDGASRVRRHR